MRFINIFSSFQTLQYLSKPGLCPVVKGVQDRFETGCSLERRRGDLGNEIALILVVPQNTNLYTIPSNSRIVDRSIPTLVYPTAPTAMPSLSLKAFFLLVLAVPGLAAPLDGTRKVVKRCRAHASSASGNSFFGQSKDHTTSVTTSSASAPTTSTSSEAAVQSEAAPTSSEAPPASSAAAQPSASAATDPGSGSTGNADADLFVKLHTDFRAQYGESEVHHCSITFVWCHLCGLVLIFPFRRRRRDLEHHNGRLRCQCRKLVQLWSYVSRSSLIHLESASNVV